MCVGGGGYLIYLILAPCETVLLFSSVIKFSVIVLTHNFLLIGEASKIGQI